MAIDVAPAKTTSPEIVWQESDRIVVRLAGNIVLDATDDEDRALFASLQAGKEIELRVACTMGKASLEWERNRDGDPVGVAATKYVTIASVWPSD